MSPDRINERVIADKIATIERMLRGLRKLPQSSLDEFLADDRTPAAAESYLRRALEALLDLGRHVLAKGFGVPINEYASIADRLREVEVLGAERTSTLREMAKYRNRMVHFYDEVTKEEIYEIVTRELRDFEDTIADLNSWLAAHPDKVRRDP